MPSTTYAEFGHGTEALEVSKAFASQIQGKTVVVTGGNRNGIAFSTAQALAAQGPAHIIVASRSPDKTTEFIDAIKADYPDVDYRALKIDLSSQASVRAAAAELLSWEDIPTVDILINTAGIMAIQERTLSEDGIEVQFATNHIGHFLFTNIILPKLIKAAARNPKGATRVINVSSASPYASSIRWSDVNFEKTNKDLPEAEQPHAFMMQIWGYTDILEKAYIPLDGYNRSKVANLLFSIGANKRLFDKHGILSLALHPGVIVTELGRSFTDETFVHIKAMNENGYFQYKTLGAGSSTTLVAALDPKLAENVGETKDDKENWGSFLDDCQISGKPTPLAASSSEAEKLWELSEKLTGQSFTW